MIYIDLQSNPPDDDWIIKADELTQTLIDAKNAGDDEEVKKIIKENSNHWKSIKDHLESLSYGKCWYSESRDVYSYYHVDHFRPKGASIDLDNEDKGGYWWLAFNWKNYRICGAVGNVYKRDKFAVKNHRACGPDDPIDDEIIYLLDPTIPTDPKKITFNEDGTVSPANPDERTFDYKKAKYTIKELNLYFDKLQTERKRIWRECVKKIKETNNLIKQNNNSPSIVSQTQIKSNEDWFREHIAPCSEFSAVYKSCLKKSGEDWAIDILAEHLDVLKLCQDYILNE